MVTLSPKISAIVRADNGGLGTLSRMFADYLGFHRTASISRHEGERHPERFGKTNRHAADGLTPELVEWLCRGADVLLSFECWYGALVPAMARALGLKTILLPMYECCPQRGGGLEDTDLAICPSLLDLEEMRDNTPGLTRAAKIFLPVPFDTGRIAFRPRERAFVFVHHQGHGGLAGRNGTQLVLDAWQHVECPARLLVKRQPSAPRLRVPSDARIVVHESDVPDYWDLWRGPGDVFLHPHCWDGLSLPIQEACAAGMPVVTTHYWPFCEEREQVTPYRGQPARKQSASSADCNLFPVTYNLRHGWLPRWCQDVSMRPDTRSRERICREFTAHHLTPQTIAAAVDRIYGEEIRDASFAVRAYAERHSWDAIGPAYRRLLQDLVAGKPIAEACHEA